MEHTTRHETITVLVDGHAIPVTVAWRPTSPAAPWYHAPIVATTIDPEHCRQVGERAIRAALQDLAAYRQRHDARAGQPDPASLLAAVDRFLAAAQHPDGGYDDAYDALVKARIEYGD
jgi:hypothetical protein